MYPIYQFQVNYRRYRSTNLELLEKFAWLFSFVVVIETAGESETEIELERC